MRVVNFQILIFDLTKTSFIAMKVLIITFLFLQTVFIPSEIITKTGRATYYANKFVGRKTTSGEVYTHDKFTAAHKTLPFGTKLKVTNLKNGKSDC